MKSLFAGTLLFSITAAASAQLPPRPDHVVIVIMENHGYSDVIGSPKAPYINSLVPQGASLTSFTALHHPSQPNYFEFFAAQQLDVCTDTCPTALYANDNLASVALAAGVTFRGYAEDLPAAEQIRTLCSHKQYARRHLPWTYFGNVPLSRSADFSAFPTSAAGYRRLPRISMVIPNLIHNMHSGPTPIEAADAWLKANLDGYIQWAKHHNSLFVLTWDEDSSEYPHQSCCPGITMQPPDNRIATLVVGANVQAGGGSAKPYNHYDLLRTILDLYGLPSFANARTAEPITDIWSRKRTSFRGP